MWGVRGGGCRFCIFFVIMVMVVFLVCLFFAFLHRGSEGVSCAGGGVGCCVRGVSNASCVFVPCFF